MNYESMQNNLRLQSIFRQYACEKMIVTVDGDTIYAKGSELAVLRLYGHYVKAGVSPEKVGFEECFGGYHFWLKVLI